MPENLMPIGRFAKSCRLTIKALRHYDDIGLLKPASIDPQTGYRYYTKAQAKQAIKIGMLRSLEIPIPTISKLLRCEGEQFHTLLASEQVRLQQELENKQRILASLKRLANHGELMPYQVQVRVEPAYMVAEQACLTNTANILDDSATAIYQLYDELQRVGRGFQDPVMCINGDPDKHDHIQVRACIGISEPYPDSNFLQITDIPSTTVAWLLHQGPYDELGLAYHSLFAWIQEHGYDQAGDMREIYKNNPAEVAPAALQTEVMVPIK